MAIDCQNIHRGVSWGALGARPPGVTKGAPKKRNKGKEEREKKKEEKKDQKKGGDKKEKR